MRGDGGQLEPTAAGYRRRGILKLLSLEMLNGLERQPPARTLAKTPLRLSLSSDIFNLHLVVVGATRLLLLCSLCLRGCRTLLFIRALDPGLIHSNGVEARVTRAKMHFWLLGNSEQARF